MEFGFELPPRPEGSSDVAWASIALGAIAGQTTVEYRSLVRTPDGRLENVAEHSYMLAVVAPAIADEFFPMLDSGLVSRHATLHDTLEAYVGDTRTDFIDGAGLKVKEQREKAALDQIRTDYAFIPSFVALIDEYEAQVVPEARFVRMMDKITTVLAHLNDEGRALAMEDLGIAYVQENSELKCAEYRADYPDQEAIISLREELSEILAQKLEVDEQAY